LSLDSAPVSSLERFTIPGIVGSSRHIGEVDLSDSFAPSGWPFHYEEIGEPSPAIEISFPDYIWLPVLPSLFTPSADRVDIAARLADFTAADMDALAGHDRVILPGAGAWETYTFADTFHGGRGNDTVTGRDGWDNVAGDAGNDNLSGRAGLDSLYGGTGRDRLDGGADSDALYGGDQADILQGGTGVDSLWGEGGDDFLYVGQQTALVDGRETRGGHLLDGGAGNDRLDAWGADNTLRDRLTGGAGADTFSVRGGDLITDFAQADSISMLGARTTDWMSAVRDPDGTVTLRFHNNALRSVADLELDGGLAPRGFYATGSIGAWSVIGYQEPIAATRPEVLTLARALLHSVQKMKGEILQDGFEFAGKQAAKWIGRQMIAKEDVYMPVLREYLGDDLAKKLAAYLGGKAYDFGKAMVADPDGRAEENVICWPLLRDGSALVLKFALGGSPQSKFLVDLGVEGLTMGAKVFQHAVTLMTNSIRDDLLYQADLALQDRSLIIVREPGADDLRLAPPPDDGLSLL
jgi:RTX calcium-binding nonapeptide repeat (4 copies)